MIGFRMKHMAPIAGTLLLAAGFSWAVPGPIKVTDIRCPDPPYDVACSTAPTAPYNAWTYVLIEDPSGLSVFGLDVLYDSSKLTFVSCRPAGIVTAFTFKDCNDLPDVGTFRKVRVGGFTTSAVASTSPDSLAAIQFTVNPPDDNWKVLKATNFTDDLAGNADSLAVRAGRSTWGKLKTIYR